MKEELLKQDIQLKESMKNLFESWLPSQFKLVKYKGDDWTWHVQREGETILSVSFLGIDWTTKEESREIWIKKIYHSSIVKTIKLKIDNAEKPIKSLLEFLLSANLFY